MASVTVAPRAGACFGVNRGLSLVEDLLEGSVDGPIYTLGPLIHNPVVISSLEARGVRVVDSLSEVEEGATVVIRCHGVPPSVFDEAHNRQLNIIDATCPFVTKVQKKAEELAQNNYEVVILGEDGHPEVEGIKGHAPGARVICSVEEAGDAAASAEHPIGMVVQTTQSERLFDEVAELLKEMAEDASIHNTICAATHERQRAAVDLARQVDLMIVIGGRNSGNTTRLRELCEQETVTHLIETPDEIDPSWLEGVESIGITAGASTPQSHIDEVKAKLEVLLEGNKHSS